MENTENLVLCKPHTQSRPCGIDAACTRHPSNKYSYCVCAQNREPMNKETRCSLNIVKNVSPSKAAKLVIHVPTSEGNSHNDSRLIPNIPVTIPEYASKNVTNVTQPLNNPVPIDRPITVQSLPILYPIIGVVSVVLFVFICCLMYCTYGLKKKKNDKNKAFAIQLDKPIIVEERYTSNPQYAPNISASIIELINSLSVPAFTKESLTGLVRIGEGHFGEVYKGTLHSIDQDEQRHEETVAVKMLKGIASPVVIEDFVREVEIMSSFQHPNILTLMGTCPQGACEPPWMVFEYMPYGDLAAVLRNPEKRPASPNLSAEVLLSIASQIAAGMEYLAAQRFVHRDLACRNCLVGDALMVKISDFGMSRDVYTCDYYRIGGTRMLPVRWMSPESLVYGKCTLESDVWSYGVLLWEIYTFGKQPYFGHTNEQVLKLVHDNILLDIPANCPHEVAEIMRLCWKREPKERIQFLDICNRLSALKDHMLENPAPALPRPPPMPVTVDCPLRYDDDDEDFDDNLDEDNYLRPTILTSNSSPEPEPEPEPELSTSVDSYIEMIP